MKLKSFQIRNFKCFDDTGLVSLSEGMNVVSGPNNAGKTALLQALELRFEANQHRSIRSMPQKGILVNTASEVEFTVAVTRTEFRAYTKDRNLHLPYPDMAHMPESLRAAINPQSPYSGESQERFWNWFWDLDGIDFKLTTTGRSGAFGVPVEPSHGLFKNQPNQAVITHLWRQVHPSGQVSFSTQNMAPSLDLGTQLAPALVALIYRFSAERFARGTSAFGTNTVLEPNALNLAEVLHVLQSSNPEAYADYVAIVQQILPQVKWVSVVPIPNNQLRIDVWVVDKKSKRDDLAIALDESGTGIGQVLAIVYVAYQTADSRVILIDEPQSFLHPGAARKLIEVLKHFSQHQYIISTHSAGVIAAADAEEIMILQNEAGTARIEVASTSDNLAMKSFLSMLGARLSDVFGMDRIIWVEGPTEEKALPLLANKLGKSDAGTAIISIRNTGDLVGKDRDKFFDIYSNLTAKASILPREIAFIFDSEERSPEAKADIVRRSKGKAHFLPRRMFENYLLNVDAIHAIVNAIPGFVESGELPREQIASFLDQAITRTDYWKPFPIPESPSLSSPELRGANILSDLFAALSNHRCAFEKTEHSVSLFSWLLENDFAFLSDLVAFMEKILADT